MWKCPACGGKDALPTHEFEVNYAATYYVRPWVDRDRYDELVHCISELWGANTARLVRCGQCGLRSADPFVAGDEKFYSLAYGRGSAHPYPASRWEYQLTQKVIALTPGTVLEIGAGDGAFQRSTITRGVDPSRLHVTEFNEVARKELANLGVTVSGADFRELGAADHSVVCGHQVFEHLDDLDEAFKAFDRLTAPDGCVALSVPNGTNKMRAELAGGQIDMPPNHVSTWNSGALEAAARRRGWKVVDIHEEPIPRLRAARDLAISRTSRARMTPNSLPALVERSSKSPQSRYRFMAVAAAARFPAAYWAAHEPYGGSLWLALKRT